MMRSLCDLDRDLGWLHGLGESAKVGKTQHEVMPSVHRDWAIGPEAFIDCFWWQRGETRRRQLNDARKLAAVVILLCEIGRGEEPEAEVLPPLGDGQRSSARRHRLVHLAEMRVGVRHHRTDAPTSAVVVQPLGEGLGLPQALPRPPGVAKLSQARSELKPNIDPLLSRGPILRE